MSDNWALNGRQDYEKRANSILKSSDRQKMSVAAIVFGSVITAYWLFIAVLFIYQFVTAVFAT